MDAHILTKKNDGLLVQVMSMSERCGHDATRVRNTPLLSYPPCIAKVTLMEVRA